MTVVNRFTVSSPCPICQGHNRNPRGQGTRCYGFLSSDRKYANCTRSEFAGDLPQNHENDTYGHLLVGSCRCGESHGSPTWPERSNVSARKQPYSNKPSDDSIIYEYQWASGEPAIRVIRTPEKDFYQQHLDDLGSWVNGTGAIKPPLYRLPELLAADTERTVLLVEGEKDVDQAIQAGLVATTNSRGAKGFQQHMVSWLAGRKVLIIADNDSAGIEGANRKAELLRPHVKSVKVIQCLPGLEEIEGGDLSDWLEAKRSVTELKELAASLPEWRQASATTKLTLSKLSDFLVQPENEIAWLVDGWMPMAGSSAAIAKPKVGKSTFARNLALAVASGSDFLGRPTQQGPVIYLALEESNRRVREQFRRIGCTGLEPIYVHTGPAPLKLFEELYPFMESLNPVLVVIDPLFRAVRVQDSSAYAEMTAAFDPILRLAQSTGCHVLVLHHASKMATDATNAALGSTAIAGSVDSIFHLNNLAGERTIEAVLREGDASPKAVLTIDPETEQISLSGTVEERERGKVRDAILEITADAWLPEDKITDGVEGRTTYIRSELRSLVEDGKLAKEGKGGKSGKFHYAEYMFSCSEPYLLDTEQQNNNPEQASSNQLHRDNPEQEPLPFADLSPAEPAQYH